MTKLFTHEYTIIRGTADINKIPVEWPVTCVQVDDFDAEEKGVLVDNFDTEKKDITFIKNQCEQKAALHGVGPSEWHEISSKPLPEILAYIEALLQTSTGGAASSSSST